GIRRRRIGDSHPVCDRPPRQGRRGGPPGVPAVQDPPADGGCPTCVPRCPGSASGPHPGTRRDRGGAPRVPPGNPNLGPGVAVVSPRPRYLHALDPYYAFPATYLARVFPRII